MARPAARRPPSVPGRWRRRCGAVAQPTRRSAARWVAPPSGRASPPRWVGSAAVEPRPPTLTPTLALTLTPPQPQPEPTLPGEQWGGGEGGGEGGGGEGGTGGTGVSSERVARVAASAMQAMLGNTFAEEEGRTDASTPHCARTLGEQRAPARSAPHGLLLSCLNLASGRAPRQAAAARGGSPRGRGRDGRGAGVRRLRRPRPRRRLHQAARRDEAAVRYIYPSPPNLAPTLVLARTMALSLALRLHQVRGQRHLHAPRPLHEQVLPARLLACTHHY